MQKILSQLPNLTIATVIFNDTPTNDFNSLSAVLSAQMPSLSQKDRLTIHPLLSPKSFFTQILPPNSVDAGFCFTALHWLQRLPQSDKPHSKPLQVAAQAYSDLITFLSARHAELIPGGSLTLCIPIQGPESVVPTHECMRATLENLPKTYNLRADSLARLPMYFRTVDEVLLGIEASPGAWRVVQKDALPITHPAWPTGEVLSGPTAQAARERYARAITGQTLAAVSALVVDGARAGWCGVDAWPGMRSFWRSWRGAMSGSFCGGLWARRSGSRMGILG